MASLTFRFRTDGVNRGLRRQLLAQDGEIRADLRRRAGRVREEARRNLRDRSDVSTGDLASTIRVATADGPFGPVAQIGSDHPAALWVEEGTGVYGPHRSPIVPTRGRFMRFKPRRATRGGAFVFARQVKGQPGKHYLRDAIDAAVD